MAPGTKIDMLGDSATGFQPHRAQIVHFGVLAEAGMVVQFEVPRNADARGLRDKRPPADARAKQAQQAIAPVFP